MLPVAIVSACGAEAAAEAADDCAGGSGASSSAAAWGFAGVSKSLLRPAISAVEALA
jgi:hypothetical protein